MRATRAPGVRTPPRCDTTAAGGVTERLLLVLVLVLVLVALFLLLQPGFDDLDRLGGQDSVGLVAAQSRVAFGNGGFGEQLLAFFPADFRQDGDGGAAHEGI